MIAMIFGLTVETLGIVAIATESLSGGCTLNAPLPQLRPMWHVSGTPPF